MTAEAMRARAEALREHIATRYGCENDIDGMLGDLLAFAAEVAAAGESDCRPVLWSVKHDGKHVGNVRNSEQACIDMKNNLDRRYPDASREVVALYERPLPTPAVPMVSVPAEPTDAMLKAAEAADREYTDREYGPQSRTMPQGAYDHYKAMISAAQGESGK